MKQKWASFLYCLICVLSIMLLTFVLSRTIHPESYSIVLNTSLFIIFGFGFFLSLWFKQDEPFFLLFMTLLAYLLTDYLETHLEMSTYYTLVGFPLMCILYPINLCIFTLLRKNDLFLPSFLKKISLLSIEAIVIYVFTYLVPQLMGDALNFQFQRKLAYVLNYSFHLGFLLPIPFISLIIFTFCFSFSLYKSSTNPDYLQTSFLFVFILTFFAFSFITAPLLAKCLFLSASGCILLALFQTSHKMAFLDELTNIPARRAFLTTLHQYENQPYTLAMIDIDFFKRLNDSYGHDVGDQALRMISSKIVQECKSGTLYRYGGEEFILFFPLKGLNDVLDEIEATREIVSNTNFFLRSYKSSVLPDAHPYLASIKITLSVGVCEKTRGMTSSDVINVADEALYKAKQTGRNKTVYKKDNRFFELF